MGTDTEGGATSWALRTGKLNKGGDVSHGLEGDKESPGKGGGQTRAFQAQVCKQEGEGMCSRDQGVLCAGPAVGAGGGDSSTGREEWREQLTTTLEGGW